MEMRLKLCEMYESISNESSAAAAIELDSVVQYLTEGSFDLMDATNSQSKDELLLTISVLQKFMLKYSETLSETFTETQLLSLCCLLDIDDKLISYAACVLIATLINGHYLSYAAVSGLMSEQVVSKLKQNASMSFCSYIHRLDLCFLVISAAIQTETSHKQTMVGRLTSDSLAINWRQIVNNVFDVQFAARLNNGYQNIVYSLLKLWNKLIKFYSRQESQTDSKAEMLLIATDDLFEQLRRGLVPVLCYDKCFSVLLQTVPYCTHIATCLTVPHICSAIACSHMAMIFDNKHLTDSSHWIVSCLQQSNSGTGPCSNDSVCSVKEGTDSVSCGGFCQGCCTDVTMVTDTTQLPSYNHRLVRELVLLILRSLAVCTKSHKLIFDVKCVLESVHELVTKTGCQHLVELFSEQDDILVEVLLCSLDIIVCTRTIELGSVVAVMFEPHTLFLQLLTLTGWDHTLLLDFTMSPETVFLLYMTRYLKYQLSDWQHWLTCCIRYTTRNKTQEKTQEKNMAQLNVEHTVLVDYSSDTSTSTSSSDGDINSSTGAAADISIHESNSNVTTVSAQQKTSISVVEHSLPCHEVVNDATLDGAMTVLVRLRLAIQRLVSKNIFPFNVQPLLQLLEHTEELYEET